jgi:hypothetical protein
MDLQVPGMQPIPVTGKAVSVKDDYIVTVQGNKVSHLTVISPPVLQYRLWIPFPTG